jgi:V8-like Glu-specific endopeptidase
MRPNSVLFCALLLSSCGKVYQPNGPVPAGEIIPALGDILPVADTMRAPYRSVCRSSTVRTYVFPRRAYVSSGVLLDDNLLLTAGHNYASPKAPWSVVTDRWVQCGVGFAGRTADKPLWQLRYGFDRKKQVRSPPDYKYHIYNRDYALVRLTENVPWTSDFEFPDERSLELANGDTVWIAGYPAEYPNDGSMLYHGRATVRNVTNDTFEYELNTEGGTSGGPVWVVRDDRFIIVGIHVEQ